MAARARLPDEPVCGAARNRRVRCRGLPRLGEAPYRARLRDRRHRHQGRLVRPAAAARRAARPSAVGARVQVGADDRADEAREDPHPRRPHRRAEPVGAARARRGGRRHRFAGDAAQRGRHQPQGHSRRRQRHRAACRRRDPSGGRAGAAASEGHEAASRCRRSVHSAASTSSSPKARQCIGARTAPARRAGSSR